MAEIQYRPASIRPILWNRTGKFHMDGAKALTFWRSAGSGLLMFVLFGLFLALVQFASPDLPDNDGFYHIKLAYLMRTESLKPDFPWLPLSILNARDFYDHHFLYHVALMPFTFGDLRLGAKWAAVIFASLAFLSTWNLLKNQRIPYAGLWAVGLLAVSEAFIYRMSIPRAQSLSLAVLMLGWTGCCAGNTAAWRILAFAYVWLYDAFPLLIIMPGIHVLAAWLVEKGWTCALLYVGDRELPGTGGQPLLPAQYRLRHPAYPAQAGGNDRIRVGNEWYPYNTAQLLKNSPLALAAFVSGALALGLSGKRMDLRTLTTFLLAGLFGLMLFQARRFIEYFPPFALVFAAFAWAPLSEHAARVRRGRLSFDLPRLLLILALLPGIGLTYTASRDSIQTSKSYQTYADASAWLAQNTPQGARVFQTDWDDFPRLFFYNTHNTYLIGLDPTYMSIYDSEPIRSVGRCHSG